MSYVTRHTGLGSISDVANAAVKIVEDPCLGQVASLVLELHAATPAVTAPGAPKPPPGPTPPPKKGIGLCTAVKPLQAAIYVRKRPWILPVGGLAVVGGLVAVGYLLGRGRR